MAESKKKVERRPYVRPEVYRPFGQPDTIVIEPTEGSEVDLNAVDIARDAESIAKNVEIKPSRKA